MSSPSCLQWPISLGIRDQYNDPEIDISDYLTCMWGDDDEELQVDILAPPTPKLETCSQQFLDPFYVIINPDDFTLVDDGDGVIGGGGDGVVISEGQRSHEEEEEIQRVAFRVNCKMEVLDDGYRWRKYGKKKVKSNSNPRNYYKCKSEGCRVKKKVERDGEDATFVIVTYEGRHSHHVSPPVTIPRHPADLPSQVTA